MKRIIIYAPNVGGGGGLVLLRALLSTTWQGQRPLAILDERGRSALEGLDAEIDIKWVKSSTFGRFGAERLLARSARSNDRVFCFHNLPPIFPVAGDVVCFVHNAYIAGSVPLSGLKGWVRKRLKIERLIAGLFHYRVDTYVVQTQTIAAALAERNAQSPKPIRVMPFVSLSASADLTKIAAAAASPHKADHMIAVQSVQSSRPNQRWNFVYLSDGSAHKNHRRLFEAWVILAEFGYFPSLAVTLHAKRDARLRSELTELASRHSLKIEDLGQLPHSSALLLYLQSDALIFPSYAETFGIPLLEAKAAGLPILAPELDYVRDVCEPAATFDPFSARSIARAVRRFYGDTGDSMQPMSPQEFKEAMCDQRSSHSGK